MRTIVKAVGFLLISVGIIWLLQEYSIMPGSFLSYQVPWAHRGAVAVVVGILLLFTVSGSRS